MRKGAWPGKLRKFSLVGMDSSILIYHLEDIPRYADLTEAVFAAVMEGSLKAVISTLSVTELSVRPYSEDQPERLSAFERFLFSLPNTELIPTSYPISREAARLRAKYRIRTPDAILLATALDRKADAFLTNEARLGVIGEEGIEILVLDEFMDR